MTTSLPYRHIGPFAFVEATPDDVEGEDDAIVVPSEEELEAVPDESLDDLEERLIEAFNALYAASPNDPDTVTQLGDIATGLDTVRGERHRRTTARDEAQAQADDLRRRVLGEDAVAAEEADAAVANGEVPAAAPVEPAAEAALPIAATAAPAPAAPAADALVAAARSRLEVKNPQRINVSMREIRERAPKPDVQPRLQITAAADVPRVMAGHPFADLTDLSYAVHERAKSTPQTSTGSTNGPKVATITNEFSHTLDIDTPPDKVEAMFKELTRQDSLVAGGGWCSPSETTFDFFQIACEDGMIDLPTAGVSRGGWRRPVSPSMADVFTGTFDNSTNPWLWSETDDILTVTGSTNKPCVRVPCPTFTDDRLECYGICLTAGNLTDSAYPEATRHQIGLLRSAHYHAMNQRYIARVLAASTVVATGGFIGSPGAAFAPDFLTSASWAAIDYRTRTGMCQGDILELIAPIWAKEAFRSDLARREGTDYLSISDAQIGAEFDVRNVRVQYVNDWQVRGTNQPGGATPTTSFPSTVQFIVYAAGTFVRGNGLTLDLGVVRDSTLNAENDHTALWTEECHLIAKVGPLSRAYTLGVCVSGRVGANTLVCM